MVMTLYRAAMIIEEVEDDVTQAEYVQAAQALIDSGAAWSLQGRIGRRCMDLIEAGVCSLGERRFTNIYGNTIPSISDLAPGSIGTPEYVQTHKEI